MSLCSPEDVAAKRWKIAYIGISAERVERIRQGNFRAGSEMQRSDISGAVESGGHAITKSILISDCMLVCKDVHRI